MTTSGENLNGAAAPALQPLTAALLESVTPAEVARVIVDRGMTVLGADAGLVALVMEDEVNLEVIETFGYETAVISTWRRFPIDANLPISNVVRSREPAFVGTRAEWDALYPHMNPRSKRQTQATVDLPLMESARAFGGLHFSFPTERAFDDEERAFLLELARQCSLALSRALARAAAEEAHVREQFLARVGVVLAEALEYEKTLENLSHLMIPDLADAAQIYITREQGGTPVRLIAAHRVPEMERRIYEIQAHYGIEKIPNHPVLTAIRTGQTLVVHGITDEAVAQSAIDDDHRRLLVSLGLRAVAIIPLIARGRTLGAILLTMTHDSDRRFEASDVAFLEEVASRAAVFIDNQRLYAEAQREIAERIATEEALRDGEARHAAIVNAALDCIISMDEDQRIVEWNPAAERTFGYLREDALGRSLADLIIPERLRAAHRRGVARFLETREGPALYKRLELSAIRASGEEFPVELTIAPIEIGGAFIFTAYLRDITERVRIAEQRRTMLRDMLLSVTDGKLRLCQTRDEMPELAEPLSDPVPLSMADGIAAIRRATTAAADAFQYSHDRCSDFVTAASEAAMNAVIHGRGGEARVYGDRESRSLQVLVEDHGTGIAMDSLPRAALSRGFSTSATLGHGLKMIIEMVDRVSLVTGPDGTAVLLEKSREQRLPAWLDK